jgi:drug/metabolite transporter (DMT)-like permease
MDLLGFKLDHSLRLFCGTGDRDSICDLGFIYPIGRGTGPILVARLSALIIGQVRNAAQFTGVGVICLGLYILAISGGKGGGSGEFLFALLIGATFTGYSFIDGIGVRVATTPLSYIAWLIFVLASLFSLFLLWRRHGCVLAITRGHGKTFWIGGL